MSENPLNKTDQPEWTRASEPTFFSAGIPGFEEHKRFELVSRSDLRPFQMLRSLDDPEVALPVINCVLLKTPVLSFLSETQLKLVGGNVKEDISPYFILRVDPGKGGVTANTKAPVIINTKTNQGHQILLDTDDLRVDEPLENLVIDLGGR